MPLDGHYLDVDDTTADSLESALEGIGFTEDQAERTVALLRSPVALDNGIVFTSITVTNENFTGLLVQDTSGEETLDLSEGTATTVMTELMTANQPTIDGLVTVPIPPPGGGTIFNPGPPPIILVPGDEEEGDFPIILRPSPIGPAGPA